MKFFEFQSHYFMIFEYTTFVTRRMHFELHPNRMNLFIKLKRNSNEYKMCLKKCLYQIQCILYIIATNYWDE